MKLAAALAMVQTMLYAGLVFAYSRTIRWEPVATSPEPLPEGTIRWDPCRTTHPFPPGNVVAVATVWPAALAIAAPFAWLEPPDENCFRGELRWLVCVGLTVPLVWFGVGMRIRATTGARRRGYITLAASAAALTATTLAFEWAVVERLSAIVFFFGWLFVLAAEAAAVVRRSLRTAA